MKPTPDQEKGQHGMLPTMAVVMKGSGAEAVINAHEFDPEIHEKPGKKAAKEDEKQDKKK